MLYTQCGKGAPLIFDTDILIWVLRGNTKAAQAVEKAESRFISIVNYMELLQGSRSRKETHLIKAFLSDAGLIMLPLSETIGHRASIYVEEYGLGSGLCLADALIAATAVEHGLALCTGNDKHFRPVKDIAIKVFRS